jgi:mycothiol synthase
VAAVINELSRALYDEDEIAANEVRQWFDTPDVETLVAELPGGRVAGYADMTDQAEHSRFWIDLRVPPSEHGADVAGALIDALEARAAEAAAPGATVRIFVPPPYELVLRLVQARRYEFFRHSFQMRIDFGGELATPCWPEGITVRTFVPGRDDEAVHEAHQESFGDGFEFVRKPYEGWRRWGFREPFDPSLWLLAEDGAEIAGLCLCRSEGGADGELGWIAMLGVRRPWRRRGLGLALLLHGFAELRAHGKRGVGLGVDGLNPTGAVRLYERAGMRVVRRFDWYQKSLPM